MPLVTPTVSMILTDMLVRVFSLCEYVGTTVIVGASGTAHSIYIDVIVMQCLTQKYLRPVPLSLAVDALLAPPITPSHTSVCTLNVQVVPGLGWGCGLIQTAVVVLDFTGQEPQFSARILYLITGQLDPTGSQLKVSWVVLTLVSITLDGGRRGSAICTILL